MFRFLIAIVFAQLLSSCERTAVPLRPTPPKPEAVKLWFQAYVKEKSWARLGVEDLTLLPGKKEGLFECEITLRAEQECYVFKTKFLEKGQPVFDAYLKEAVLGNFLANDTDHLNGGDNFKARFTIFPIQKADGSAVVFFTIGVAEGGG